MELTKGLSLSLQEITSSASFVNLQSWLYKPLPNVSNRSAGLSAAPVQIDSVSQTGCKSYSLTSWNTVSRSYYVGHCVRQWTVLPKGVEPLKVRRDVSHSNLITGCDVSLKQLETVPRMFWDRIRKGEAGFTKDGTFISRINKVNTTNLDEVPIITSTNNEHFGDQEPKTSYLHTDMIPVKCVSISSWSNYSAINESIPYSAMYNAFIDRITDPQSTGALGSLVRSSVVRDAASIMSLAKTLKNHPSSVYEHAALIRSACCCASLDIYSYRRDPIINKVIRRFIDDSTKPGSIAITSNSPSAKFELLAIPLDMFVALMNNKNDLLMPPGYKYNDIDNSVTCVPIRSTALSAHWAYAYFASFADSNLWAGKVNMIIPGKWYTDDWDDRHCHVGTITTMPACNSVSIPGPSKIIIVLMDTTSADAPENITVGGLDGTVPVVRNKMVSSRNTAEYWNKTYFTSNNYAVVCSDMVGAFNDIATNLGVGSTVGHALSVCSEIYGVLSQGIGMTTNVGSVNYDKFPNGCWAWEGGVVDKKGGVIRADKWGESMSGVDNSIWRGALTGFNFATISPLHFLPSGMTQSEYTVKNIKSQDDRDIPEKIYVYWNPTEHQHLSDKYSVNTTTSAVRVAIYSGLIDRNVNTTLFGNAPALVAYLQMNACALSFSTSLFMSANDLDLHIWSGLLAPYEQSRSFSFYDKLIHMLTLDLTGLTDIDSLMLTWHEWNWDRVTSYYNLKTIDDNNFLSFSPVPISATIQWANKLSLLSGKLDNNTYNDLYQRNYVEGLLVNANFGHYKSLAIGSTDIIRYCPQLLYRQAGWNDALMSIWVDNWAYLSSISTTAPGCYRAASEYFMTGTLCLTIIDSTHDVMCANRMMILNSKYIQFDPTRTMMLVSNIVYPDPPPGFHIQGQSALGLAKDLLAAPALSALSGHLTAGPIGAAVAGTATLAKNILDRIIPNQEKVPVTPEHADDVGEGQKELPLEVTSSED